MAGPGEESLVDARDVLDQALAAEKGLRIEFESESKMLRFRFRLYSARKRDKEQARRVYEPGHPMWGKTPYAALVFYTESNSEKDEYILTVQKGSEPYGVKRIWEIK